MKCYFYSKQTFEYRSSADARENPKEKNKYLLPGSATFIEPPETGENEVAVFSKDDQAWDVCVDYRGQVYYSILTKERVVISEIGEEPNANMVLVEPPSEHYEWDGEMWALSLEAAKSLKLSELAAKRYEIETGGLEVNGLSIKTDDRTKTLINGAYSTAVVGNVTDTVDYKIDSSTWITLTNGQVISIALAISAFVQACFTAEKVHAAAILLLESVDDVDAYDITTGWPDAT